MRRFRTRDRVLGGSGEDKWLEGRPGVYSGWTSSGGCWGLYEEREERLPELRGRFITRGKEEEGFCHTNV